MRLLKIAVVLCFLTSIVWAQGPDTVASVPKGCDKFGTIDDKASKPITSVSLPPHGICHPKPTSDGTFLPDPTCTPGAINPTLTEAILKDPAFRTGCVRNDATSETQKASTYKWYHTKHPKNNQGATQTCELDHLIPLYLGGADTLENIWPQCGPARVHLDDRFFKEKDKVEFYLGQQVRAGKMDLAVAQKGIAEDWTKFLADAEGFCASGKCEFHGQ
jgi:hypothetical protein